MYMRLHYYVQDLQFGINLGKEIVVLGLLTRKKRVAIFTLWRAVADNLANGHEIQIGFLDMYVINVGQLKKILTVHVQLNRDKRCQKQLMVLVVELLYMRHHQ